METKCFPDIRRRNEVQKCAFILERGGRASIIEEKVSPLSPLGGNRQRAETFFEIMKKL